MAKDNKFAFLPGQVSKLLNPKSLSAFCALGGLVGLEKGLRPDQRYVLSADETVLTRYQWMRLLPKKPFVVVVTAGTASSPAEKCPDGPFADRKRVFRDNSVLTKGPPNIF
jgi:P-type Ca2+ transporter type 2C